MTQRGAGAAVTATGQRLVLDLCEVTDAGAEGVSIGAEEHQGGGEPSHDTGVAGVSHQITRSSVARTGLAGVVVSCGDRETLSPCNAVIADNNISNFGMIGYTYNAGVALAVRDCTAPASISNTPCGIHT